MRVETLDLLRGLVVALMVLDHVREYFSAEALQFDPLDVSQTSVGLFATRWITHLCAPTFVFLAGLSAYLQRANGMPAVALRRRLAARGLWLVALEITIIGFAFNFAAQFLFLQVIWAIGIGMIALAGLTFLPRWAIGLVGLLALVGTPYLAAAGAELLPQALVHALFSPGPLAPLPGIVAYPALPWLGILALGYAAGPLLAREPDVMRRRATIGGIVLIAVFAALRIGGIGDARSGGEAPNFILQLLTNIDVTKYPPSLQYACITLGAAGLLLALLTLIPARRLPTLAAFGRAPFFTYILHIYLIHLLALIGGLFVGIPAAAFTHFIENSAALREAGWGFGLLDVYLLWLLVALLLHAPASWFARLKRRRSDWWLSYL